MASNFIGNIKLTDNDLLKNTFEGQKKVGVGFGFVSLDYVYLHIMGNRVFRRPGDQNEQASFEEMVSFVGKSHTEPVLRT